MIIRNHKITPLELSDKQRKSPRNQPSKSAGLGDRIEKLAQPIARVIDKVAGTRIQGCGACQKRKEYLNKKFPNT